MRACFLGLVVAALAGCASEWNETSATTSSSLMQRFRLFRPGLGPDTVPLEITVVRQPLGGRTVNEEIWREADEQVIPLEMRGTLEANGYRIGTIGGTAPPVLQTLLASPRSVASAQRAALKLGKPLFVPLGRGDTPCALKVVQEGETTALTLDKAQCGLALEIALADDGDLVLRFEPRVRHGDQQLSPRPAADRSDWTLTAGRPEEKYPRLAWEVSLAANEYVLIGGLPDRPHTLGHGSFIRVEEDSASQDVLVIRATRPPGGPLTVTSQRPPSPTEPVPLALQSIATKGKAANRGQSPEGKSP
jgi:hypothetical protein